MQMNKYSALAAIASLTFVAAASAAPQMTGGLVVDAQVSTSLWTPTSVALDPVNYVFGSSDAFSSVQTFSVLTADSSTITGLSTTATAENIPDFFVFSSASFLASGTSPANRFDFTLTSLTDSGGGSFSGAGTVIDTTGAFANTPATFTLGFSGPNNYGFTFDAIPSVPDEASASGLLAIGLGALSMMKLRRKA